MRTRQRMKKRLLVAGSLVAPIVAVQAARFVFDGGPSSAQATTSVDDAAMPHLPARPIKPMTTAQQRAAAWLSEHAAPESLHTLYADLRSPMDHPPPRVEEPARVEASPTEPPPSMPVEEFDPHRLLKVSSIMVDRAHAIAFINGRLCKVGDEPLKGWTITHVDGKTRVVVLTNVRGDEAVLEPETP